MTQKKRWDFEAEKTLGLKIEPTKCKIFFFYDITEKRRLTILASFQSLCHGIKTPKKDELIILGSSLCRKSQADLLEKKSNEPEKSNGIVEQIDAHFVFFWVEKLLQSAKVPSSKPVPVLIIQRS